MGLSVFPPAKHFGERKKIFLEKNSFPFSVERTKKKWYDFSLSLSREKSSSVCVRPLSCTFYIRMGGQEKAKKRSFLFSSSASCQRRLSVSSFSLQLEREREELFWLDVQSFFCCCFSLVRFSSCHYGGPYLWPRPPPPKNPHPARPAPPCQPRLELLEREKLWAFPPLLKLLYSISSQLRSSFS